VGPRRTKCLGAIIMLAGGARTWPPIRERYQPAPRGVLRSKFDRLPTDRYGLRPIESRNRARPSLFGGATSGRGDCDTEAYRRLRVAAYDFRWHQPNHWRSALFRPGPTSLCTFEPSPIIVRQISPESLDSRPPPFPPVDVDETIDQKVCAR
jgi:hypothetical protein